ncbi:MAG: PIN domain-containing protein [Verrucomicrobia bacterium]|nr:PIN domain-containing protein [Verrucomicrobiota bacterium]
MKLPHVNIWLALTLSQHSHHRATRAWLDAEEERASLCFCRATQQGLVRLLTTAEVLASYGNPPLTNREAWEVYEHFMEDERVTFLNEPEGVEETWQKLAMRDTPSPKVWMDAWLAALALHSGIQMVTTYKTFSQFKGLHLVVVKAK